MHLRWSSDTGDLSVTLVIHVGNWYEPGDEESSYHCVRDALVNRRASVEVEIQQTESDVDEQTSQLHQDENELQ